MNPDQLVAMLHEIITLLRGSGAGLWPDDSDAHLVGPDLRTGEPWPRPGVEVLIEDAKEEAA